MHAPAASSHAATGRSRTRGAAHSSRPAARRCAAAAPPRASAERPRSGASDGDAPRACAPLSPPAWEGARRTLAGTAAAVIAAASLLSPLQAEALDTSKVGSCLLSSCQVQLAACIADEKCAESLVCLNKCNNTTDEAGCQARARCARASLAQTTPALPPRTRALRRTPAAARAGLQPRTPRTRLNGCIGPAQRSPEHPQLAAAGFAYPNALRRADPLR
jgi:hypothetical protein